MDVKEYIRKLANQQNEGAEKYILPERDLRRVINKAKEILMEESNVQPVIAPVNVCGDIHGQFFDLLNLFRTAGEIEHDNSYIFIGDFVDRGYNSVETMEYLLCLKVAYPERVTLLRGNHESRNITMAYGFFDEIQRKYGNTNPWKLFTDLFDYLPIAALIEGQVLCVHGGLSPDMKTLDQIRTIDRKQEIPMEGPFADLMWSDPEDSMDLWAPNMRGAGWLFGKKVVYDFNKLNSLKLICRAHQLVQDGYQYKFDENLVTVWSAPNYCYRMKNKGVVLQFDCQLNRKEIEFTDVEISDKQDPPRKVLPYFL